MQLKRFYVTKLFGLFDHEVILKRDRATIIHAPNGFGKTTLIRLLHSLCAGNFASFLAVPFNDFGIELADGRLVKVSVQPEGSKKKRKSVVVQLGKEEWKWSLDERPDRTFPIVRQIDRDFPDLSRIGPDLWRTPDGRLVQLEDLVAFYPNLAAERLSEDVPEWLTELRNDLPTRLVRAERLALPEFGPANRRSPSDGVFRPTVVSYAEELQSLIRRTLAEYGAVSQSLDQSFPQRLVGATNESQAGLPDLEKRLEQLAERRRQFAETGLLDLAQEQPLPAITRMDGDTARVLSVYVTDSERKLSVLDDLHNRLSLLIAAVRKRFKHKSFTVSRNDGFGFIADSGQALRATDLSSGEQHELILLYELLFKVPQGTLLLIDEPEISLHVAWQMSFLEDTLRMAEAADIHVLIATHSPQIINNRWDLTVELKDVGR